MRIRFAAWLLLILCLACGGARADTPIALFKSFAGNVNFVGTQKTMRTASNTVNACSVATAATTLTAALSGIPASATIVSAHLYWAGSNTVGDYTVTFEGASVTAPAGRQFSSNTDGDSFYFSGAADVTAQVIAKRNGNYSFSGLTINSSAIYCDTQAVLGGFSLVVIFSDPGQTYRVLNLYEGFQYIRTFGTENSQAALSLSNFQIPNPIGAATGRVGHITWEGDTSLSGGGEELRFNGTEIVDGNNPTGNQFNSYSNINADAASYGIDFDAYTIASPIIGSGQTAATTTFKSGQDLVLLSAEIIAVPNVPVADLQLAMVRAGTPDRGASVSFTSTATNLGPTTDTGPIRIQTTFATGLTYVSGTGTGWTCSAAGQVVSCTNPASLAMGASLPTVVLNATIDSNAPNVMSTTAVLSGGLYDNVAANNSVEDKISLQSDLQISMTLLDSPLTLGQQNAFLVTVKNNGPVAELGPVQVTSTLPASLRFLSGSGTNWSCSAAGQLMTCAYTGQLANGVTAPLLTVNFTVQGYAATVAATLDVDGPGADSNTSNDSATLSMSMTVPRWVFTDVECTHNRALLLATQPCKILSWGTQTGGTTVPLWLTNLNTSGVPTRLSGSNDTILSMSFALTCHNPVNSGGTFATFAGITFKACKANGADPVFTTATDWSALSLTFFRDSPSSGPYNFTYEDVGRIELFTKETSTSANRGSSGQFIFKPLKLVLSTTGNGYATGLNHLSPVFARAGAFFPLTVTAYTRNTPSAKNFGREITPETIAITASAATDTATSAPFTDMVNVPAVSGSFGTFSTNNGAATGAAFSWNEAGIPNLTASLADADYLGSGPVDGDPLTVGRFVPNHFTTVVTLGMACTTTQNMASPCNGRGMHYSAQPIVTTVSAHAAAGTVLRNFQGKFARAVTLSPSASSGGAVLAAGSGTLNNTALAATLFSEGVASATPSYTLPLRYLNDGVNGGFSAPLDVFLRADQVENPTSQNVSSLRFPAASSVEGGTRILVGRMHVPHGYGSELLARQVEVRAQYWNGSGWENSVTDSVTSSVFTALFNPCEGALIQAGTSCKSILDDDIVAPLVATLVNGSAVYRFRSSGPGNIGVANVRMNGPAWLPSSTGRWRYGIYKPTPVIYIREVF
ncbi:MAG: DUF6701 domain-containing protein [Pseudomonadota bacterium]